jgi:hypothetical protein
MAKIILKNGKEEFVSAGEARAKVQAGEASWPKPAPYYSTRQLTAETPEKPVRKRRTKAEIEADQAESDEAE